MFLITGKTLQGHNRAYCLRFQRSLTEPRFPWFVSSLQMARMDGENEITDGHSTDVSSLFANIAAAKFAMMQRCLE